MNPGIIGGCLVLIILAITVVVALKKSQDKKAVQKFISGLEDKIFEITLETIKDIDPKQFDSFETFSKTVLNNVYIAVWDYVGYTAEEAVEVNQITKAVFKLIDKETVVKFIDALFESKDIYGAVQDTFLSNKIENMPDVEKEDKELQEEYSNQEMYVENSDDFDLPLVEEKEIPAEELEKLNPPQEEEDENISIEDDSVEIITDKKEIITTKSKNGQTLYYEIDENGKKTRVSKEYALQHLEEN